MESWTGNRFPFLFIVGLAIPIRVLSIDMESAMEMPCFTPDQSLIAQLNVTWALSMKTLYYPIMSRFDLYVGAVDQTGLDPKDIAENTLYYNGCITWTLGTEPNSFFQNGLGINGKKYFIQLIDPGVATFSNADGGFKGISYTILTDNKTYFLALNCYTEWDQMTWSIASATETLPEETAKLVYDTVLPIGFKREQFTGLRYETCKGSQPDNRPGHGWPKREEE